MPDRRQFYALYLARFAGGFGFVTLVNLIPFYISVFDANGLLVGLFYTAFSLAQLAATVPIAWLGDRGDKRTVLLACLAIGTLVYATFGFVGSALGFVVVRAFQGAVVAGMGLLTLGLVGELAGSDSRANHIGKANAARFAASILGALSAGALYQFFGFTPVFTVITVLFALTLAAVYLTLDPDDTRVPGFPFSDLALNRRILTLTAFRAPYAVAVTLTRNWILVFAGAAAAQGGLGYGSLAVSVILVAEKFTNMLCQPHTGRLSDTLGRSRFVFFGGTAYGLVALVIPFAPTIGRTLALPTDFPLLGPLTPAFLVFVAINALLGIADAFREPASMALFADEGSKGSGVASSFGVRDLVWRPGSILAPILAGYFMSTIGMQYVFWTGGIAAIIGALAFLLVLTRTFGFDALSEW